MKNKKYQDHARFIWKSYIAEKWPYYLVGIFSVLVTNIMQIWAPKNLGWIIDFFADKPLPEFFVGTTKEETFIYLFAALLVSRVLLNLFRFGWRISLGRQTHYAAAMLRQNVWEHARYFKKDDLNKRFSKGALMSASASDSMSARFVFGFTLIGITDVAFLGLFTFIAMGLIHLPMAIFSFLSLLFIPLLVNKLVKKESAQYRSIQETQSEFNDLSAQAVSTIKLQRLTQTGPFWERRLMNIAEIYRQKKLTGAWLSLQYTPIMGMATIVTYIFLFGLGIYYVFNNQMSVGEFISMQGLIFLIHDPLMGLGFIISEWKRAFTALERLSEVYLHEKEEFLLREGAKLDTNSTDVVLDVRDLSYSFENSKSLFSNLNFQLKKGQRLGITGPIGAGKSTLLNLLSGLDQSHNGSILFYGKPIGHYAHLDLRHTIAQVSQKPFLFADSIRVNVSMDQNLSDEEIWHFLDLAGLKEDILNFPDQLDTQLGEWGINLSGGQKQRLTLARSLARRPKVLFLDDCLSAVDTITEEKILKNLDENLKEATLIWVAHRDSTLKYCDFTFELKGDE